MRRFHLMIAGLAMAGLSSCGGKEESPAAPEQSETAAAPAEAAATGPSLADAPQAFAQCVACHTIKPGMNAVGPSLFGVYGRKAGTGPGYAYSDAMKNYGVTWDEASLDIYLTAPMQQVPGTKMVFAGQADPAKRKEIIDFLKSLK